MVGMLASPACCCSCAVAGFEEVCMLLVLPAGEYARERKIEEESFRPSCRAFSPPSPLVLCRSLPLADAQPLPGA